MIIFDLNIIKIFIILFLLNYKKFLSKKKTIYNLIIINTTFLLNKNI